MPCFFFNKKRAEFKYLRIFALSNTRKSMKLIKFCIFLFAGSLVLFASCGNRPTLPATPAEADTANAPHRVIAERDSTLYGEAGDFGMSTFSLVTDGGDSLLLTRTSEDGRDSQIYGDAQPGDRYAIIVTADRQALVTAINLTQLRRFTRDYKIVNGRLILTPESSPDEVRILYLDNDSLVVKGANGTQRMRPLKE